MKIILTLIIAMLMCSCSSNAVELNASNANANITVKGSKINVNGVKFDYNKQFDDNVEFIALTVFNNQFMGIAKNRDNGETKILTSVAGTVWTDMTPDEFADSDIAPYTLKYLKAFPLSDRCFLISEEGVLVTITNCAKCTSAKRVADFKVIDAQIDDTILKLIGTDESKEINLSEMHQTNIQKDAVLELTAQGAYLIDVRDVEDFASGSIEGAINVPLDEFEDWISTKSKDDTFIMFCQKGIKSASALEKALEMGYEKSYLAGAIDNLK